MHWTAGGPATLVDTRRRREQEEKMHIRSSYEHVDAHNCYATAAAAAAQAGLEQHCSASRVMIRVMPEDFQDRVQQAVVPHTVAGVGQHCFAEPVAHSEMGSRQREPKGEVGSTGSTAVVLQHGLYISFCQL